MYSFQSKAKKALELFNEMPQKGVLPNKFAYVSILDACAGEAALTEGKKIHASIAGSSFGTDVLLGTTLVNMYGKCGSLKGAQMMFDSMPNRNVVTWNAMMSVYVQNGLSLEALRLLNEMMSEGVISNKVTCIVILDACARQAAFSEGKRMHARIMHSGFEKDVVLVTALLKMYGKCDSLKDAESLFQNLSKRDIILWTAMTAVCSQHGEGKKSIQIFERMQQEGEIPDKVTFVSILEACGNEESLMKGKQVHTHLTYFGIELDVIVATALVDMYAKCGEVEIAWKMFNTIAVPNVVSWNAMIAAYSQHGHDKAALQLFGEMHQEGMIADKVTFVNTLSACANQAVLMEGKQKHIIVIHRGFELDVVVGTGLVNMYGKCGNLEDAWEMFNMMPERSVISWNCMIAAYSQHGNGKEALQLFMQMLKEGVPPTKVTFLNVLTACSHSGLVDEGHDCIISMKRYHGMTPTAEHYATIVDLLRRAGRLDEAKDLICKMPFQSTIVSWMTLLGAFRDQIDVDRGETAAKICLNLIPEL